MFAEKCGIAICLYYNIYAIDGSVMVSKHYLNVNFSHLKNKTSKLHIEYWGNYHNIVTKRVFLMALIQCVSIQTLEKLVFLQKPFKVIDANNISNF